MAMTETAKAVLDTIRNRRSMRSFRSGMIPEDILDSILEAGTWAPTGKGLQSPVIVVLTKEEDRRHFSSLNAKYSRRIRSVLRSPGLRAGSCGLIELQLAQGRLLCP